MFLPRLSIWVSCYGFTEKNLGDIITIYLKKTVVMLGFNMYSREDGLMRKILVIAIFLVNVFSIVACSKNDSKVLMDEEKTISNKKEMTDNDRELTTENVKQNTIEDVDLWNEFEIRYENAEDKKTKEVIEQEIIDLLADNLTGTYELRNDWATTFFWKSKDEIYISSYSKAELDSYNMSIEDTEQESNKFRYNGFDGQWIEFESTLTNGYREYYRFGSSIDMILQRAYNFSTDKYDKIQDMYRVGTVALENANDMANKRDKQKEEASKPKEPYIGMTADEVEKSTWGEPNKKNKDIYSWGIKEQWVYSGGYIYLENGMVTSISIR